jgi:hypothetical protein
MTQLNVFPVIAPQTGAVVSQIWDATACDNITVSADFLAGGETVTLQVVAGDTFKQITDIYGTVVNLTATISSVALEGGARYVFTKSATASACGVYVSVKTV